MTSPTDLHAKLAALGLVAPRSRPDNGGIPTTIGRLWEDFLSRRPDLKKWTRSNLEQTKLRCIEFFKLKPVAAITQGEAKDFRRWLVEKKLFTRDGGWLRQQGPPAAQ